MKMRMGFVSNSSSASFVVETKWLTEMQIYKIFNHIEIAKNVKDFEKMFGYAQSWKVTRINNGAKAETLEMSTSMTNFDMEAFLKYIGVDISKVNMMYHT